MSVWVKVCANTSLADAMLAVDAGADAVGFVFAPSPRRVTTGQVAGIVPQLPPTIEKVGVFVDSDLATIAEIVEACGLTGVQLHSGAEAGVPAQLKARFGPMLRVLKVLHSDEASREAIAMAGSDPNVDAVLVDSRTAGAVGGTGVRFDWQAAADGAFTERGPLKLVVAGGLDPVNVAEAIELLRPWGVDVASGVEASPGRKDPGKVAAFVAAARSAALSQAVAGALPAGISAQ